MKPKIMLALLALLLAFQHGISQTYFETSWVTGGITYTGLVIYYDDDDALMRVKFRYNDRNVVAEFKCHGEYFEESGMKGYLLDGQDAKVVIGSDVKSYSADNFIFIDSGGSYGTPIHVDDQDLEKEDIENHLTPVAYWSQMSTDKFTEAYVSGFFLPTDPLYQTLLSYNLQYNANENPDNSFRITAMSYGSEEWAVAMSKGSGYATQSWKTSPDFPEAWIDEKWNDDLDITAIAYGDGEWAVAMSKGTGYDSQTWTASSDFPEDWIDENWKEEYDITALAFGNGEWAVAMSQGTGFSSQTWTASSDFPKDWIDENWKEDAYITAIAYGNGEWMVVMSGDAGFSTQSWKTSSIYPKDWIREKWDAGYDITSLAYGGGQWAVVMSKGTSFSTQSWKTSSNYPKDWIREKWDERPGATPNTPTTPSAPADQPEVVENSKLHLVLVANTLINDIGASCAVDKNNALREFEIICEELEIPFSKTIIDDRQFSKQTVTAALNSLNPGANDVVVFVYSGHGFRWSNQNSDYPNIDLRYSKYQNVSDDNTFNLSNIYNTIISKGARLNIVLGDCCNSDLGVSNRGGEASLISSRADAQGRVDKLRNLFLESRGNLIAAAAKPFETSCGNSRDGGYFLSSFFSALGKETSQLNENSPSWNNIITRTISTASYKTQNLSGCDPQNGIFYSNIK